VRIKKQKHRKRFNTPSGKTAVLEQFTARDLEIWETRSVDLQAYQDRAYFDLERPVQCAQRQAHTE
jgi:hypothetical protein